jgi:predicted NACHT family NTPase
MKKGEITTYPGTWNQIILTHRPQVFTSFTEENNFETLFKKLLRVLTTIENFPIFSIAIIKILRKKYDLDEK